MSGVLDEVPLGARVSLIRLRSLGDCVLSTPAIRLLKAARPDLRIALVTDTRWSAVYEMNPDVAVVLPPRVAAMRAWAPSLVLNLHGGTTSARLTALSGARWRAAWSHFRYRVVYNVHLPTAQQILGVSRTVHTAEHAASAIFALGVPVQPIPRACLFAKRAAPRPPYALIHPLASEREKTWPAEHFLAASAFLKAETNLEPVFLGAPADDLSPFRGFSLAQGQSLSETKSLTAAAELFLGNDSGPAHIAAAFGLPCAVLFGPSNPEIWGPWRTPATVLQALPLSGLSPERVTSALSALLRPLGAHA